MLSSLWYISFCSSGHGKHFFRQSIRLHEPTHSLSPSITQWSSSWVLPVSSTIYVGTGNGSSMARECCDPFKTGRTHCSPMETGDKKQANEGAETWCSRPRRIWQEILASDQPVPAHGVVLLDCMLRQSFRPCANMTFSFIVFQITPPCISLQVPNSFTPFYLFYIATRSCRAVLGCWSMTVTQKWLNQVLRFLA